ncbi:Isochorismatase hydrolase [Hypomontagnella submonticulosa]|nr:Isochorismatase hydrolase [Hypomontagnella submonticulosa]
MAAERLEAMFNPADITTPGHYGPSQTALLLLDFHTMLVRKVGGPKAVAALETAAKVRAWAKSQGIQVIHCLIDFEDTPFPTCMGADKLGQMVAMAKADGGEEAIELSEGGSDGEVTFTRKPGHVSALKSPGLEDFLKQKGVTSLVLTGLSTSGCVMRTAVAATDAEYVVTVISDGCADPAEDVHEVMVGKVLSSRGYVVTAAEFQEGFTKAQNRK